MAKIKYADGEVPIRNEHSGYTFIPNRQGQSVFPGQRNSRHRYPNQWLRMQALFKATTYWRNMSAGTKANWDAFAAAFPQPSKKDASVFLTGFQLFIKRNSYCFLNWGMQTDFMTEPVLSEISTDIITIAIKNDPAATFSIDVTAEYLRNFGILPQVGDTLLFLCPFYSAYSGQFFEPIQGQVIVEELYLDGLFVSIYFPEDFKPVTLSLFLSYHVSPGVSYVGSKTRYMGCVQTENSFNCDDLLDCEIIVQLQNTVNVIAESIVDSTGNSIPPIRLGLLYNYPCVNGGLNISVSDDWIIPADSHIQTLVAFVGTNFSDAGGYLKETGLTNWQTPNTGATDSFGFHWRGSGFRITNGTFSNLFLNSPFWTTVESAISGKRLEGYYNGANSGYGFYNKHYGVPIRLLNPSTSLQNGETGIYIGNNGYVYPTVCIGTQEWITVNLAETLFRDLSVIPEVTDNAAWSVLSTPALCAYNNDWSNV